MPITYHKTGKILSFTTPEMTERSMAFGINIDQFFEKLEKLVTQVPRGEVTSESEWKQAVKEKIEKEAINQANIVLMEKAVALNSGLIPNVYDPSGNWVGVLATKKSTGVISLPFSKVLLKHFSPALEPIGTKLNEAFQAMLKVIWTASNFDIDTFKRSITNLVDVDCLPLERVLTENESMLLSEADKASQAQNNAAWAPAYSNRPETAPAFAHATKTAAAASFVKEIDFTCGEGVKPVIAVTEPYLRIDVENNINNLLKARFPEQAQEFDQIKTEEVNQEFNSFTLDSRIVMTQEQIAAFESTSKETCEIFKGPVEVYVKGKLLQVCFNGIKLSGAGAQSMMIADLLKHNVPMTIFLPSVGLVSRQDGVLEGIDAADWDKVQQNMPGDYTEQREAKVNAQFGEKGALAQSMSRGGLVTLPLERDAVGSKANASLTSSRL